MKVSVLLPYANPHVLDWVLKLNSSSLNIGCVSSTQDFRPGYFHDYDEIPGIKYFFKGENQEYSFRSELTRSDVLICLGVFERKLVKFRKYCNDNVRLIILSEPFNPLTSKKKTIVRSLWSLYIRKLFKNIDFYCIGGADAKSYFWGLGFKKSDYYNFGYFPGLPFSNKHLEKQNFREKIVIGFIGQLIYRKGVDRLIKLINYLTQTDYTFELWIAGEGILRKELEDLLNRLRDQRIKYFGLIDNRTGVEEILKDVDILFVPSHFDGWGAVVNEGISKSCAIVASSKVYAAKAMVNENVGFVFDNYFANLFERYFNEEGLLEKHQSNCLSLYELWNPESIAKEVLNNIQDKSEGRLLFKI